MSATSLPPVRSTAIAAPPALVLAYVSDPGKLPEWAPDFAKSAEPGYAGLWYLVVPSGHPGKLLVLTDPAARTVDLLDPDTRTLGAYLRIVPDGHGCVLTLSVNLGADASVAAIEAQTAVVESELQRIRERCERLCP